MKNPLARVALAFCLTLALLAASAAKENETMKPPEYFVKVLSVAGATIAASLDVASVQFTEICHVPGQFRQGDFVLTLKDSRRAPHLRTVYNTLARQQRVEIYDNQDLLGTPIFSGLLIRQTKSQTNAREWRGNDASQYLQDRKLRAYHRLTGDVNDVIASLLKTYNMAFGDDFNRTTGLGADWIQKVDWDIVSNVAVATAASGNLTSLAFTAAQWENTMFRESVYIPSAGGFTIIFPFDLPTNDHYYYLSIDAETSGYQLRKLHNPTDTLIAERTFIVQFAEWQEIKIYYSRSGSDNRIIVLVNGSELFDVTDTDAAISALGSVHHVSTTDGEKMDDFIFASATAALTIGKSEASSETIDQVFNGDTQLEAIQWICEKMGWTYRITPGAGFGNDQFDYGTTVGINWSQ